MNKDNIAHELSLLLADHCMMLHATQGVHWNVRGQMFESIHQLTQNQYEHLFEMIDEIGERIRALGYLTPARPSLAVRISNVGEIDEQSSDTDMLLQLIDFYGILIAQANQVMSASDPSDQVSLDIGMRVIAHSEKSIWMLRSLITSA